MRILIIGCGYVGIPVGEKLANTGHTVFGLRRSKVAEADLGNAGINPLYADITDPTGLEKIPPEFDVVINLVSSSKGGVEEYSSVYLEGTRNILNWLRRSPLRKYIYTSSTSVYAQADGSWVTEESPAEPDSATSQILIETENLLLSAHRSSGFPAVVLRPSGIYGPDRGHLFKQFVTGQATMRDDGSHWINMVHVDDLAAAIIHLIEQSVAGEIYNVSDEQPVTQREFFEWLAREFIRSMPSSVPADATRKRGLTNKRVSNAKLKATGFTFSYPTYREGYRPEINRILGAPAKSPYSP